MIPFRAVSLFAAGLGFAAAIFAQNADKSPFAEGPMLGAFHPSALSGAEEAYLPTLFPSSHAANLILLHNGDLLCFWFSGTWEGDSDVAIVMSRLPRGSTRWLKPMVLDHQPGKSYQNPVPFQEPNGRLWLMHTSQPAKQGQAESQVLFLTSGDNGKTWSSSKVLFSKPGSYVRQPMVLMNAREWLLPMYYTPSRGITTGAEANYSATKISTDQGTTWKECEIAQSKGLVQPSVLRLSSDHYIVFFRSRFADWIYKSTSRDGCEWAAPMPTQLPNNNSSIQAIRLNDGHLAIAFNNSSHFVGKGKPSTGPRKPLTVALSEDEGKTWPWVRDVETGGPESDNKGHFPEKSGRQEYSYPSILQGPGGKIYVAYTYRRDGIKVVSFDESWLRQGGTSGLFKGDRRPGTH